MSTQLGRPSICVCGDCQACLEMGLRAPEPSSEGEHDEKGASSAAPSREPSLERLLQRTLHSVLSGTIAAGLGVSSACVSHGGSQSQPLHADASEQRPAEPRVATPAPQASGETVDGPSEPAAQAPELPAQPAKFEAEAGIGSRLEASNRKPDGGFVPPQKVGPPIACLSDGAPVNPAKFSTEEPYDFFAVRHVLGRRAQQEPSTIRAFNLPLSVLKLNTEAGQACRSASSPACAEQVAHHEAPFAPSFCYLSCEEWSVVTTRGDEVRRWVGQAELQKLFGPIDSAEEAKMLVLAAGYGLACGDARASSVQAVKDGFIVYATKMTNDCPVETGRFKLHVSRDGTLSAQEHVVLHQSSMCVGRRPAGLVFAERPRGQHLVGEFLVQCAYLEAASVFAFARLMRELAAHGAPAELIARAREARDDEARHARVMGALTLRYGGTLSRVELGSLHVRGLTEIALENAVEGCVRETFGALVGAHQALRAQDLAVRRALVPIAVDEARHAALSHDVQAWLEARLSEADRARVQQKSRLAIAALLEELSQPRDPELERVLGLPSLAVSRSLVEALRVSLWETSSHVRRVA